MNIAQARPRSWTPHVILFSIILHAVVIYYVAVAFNIVPPLPLPTSEPPTIEVYNPPIKPPPPVETTERIKTKPPFPQRIPKPAPVAPTVAPSPITPVAGPVQGPIGMDIGGEIGEQPVQRPLPGYPRTAIERNIEGVVFLSITIMPDGSVRDVQVVSANPRGYFERAAVSSVQRWRYKPSNMVRRNVIVRMDFELRDA